MNVYFDNAATTKVRDEVIDDISNVLKDCFGNPSSTHSFGRSAKSYIETSRKSIAKIINCDPAEIIFNSCLLYTSPSPRDRTRSRMPSSA